jgi:acetoin utilization deacetylase AcuC-like enzyme
MQRTLETIPVFFRPEMTALEASSYSPSAGKPPKAVADWQAHGLPIELRSFDPVDEATLALAHDPRHVHGVLACEVSNGFGNRKPEVAASLPYTSGAMLAAAREALANGQVACAPVSGFHHAGYAQAHGFCTFNGLMVAAMALHREGRVQRVAILDLDQHWGDGTHDILQRLEIRWVVHSSSKADLGVHPDARSYLRRLPGIVGSFHDCDLLLYQAGADAHVDDPLGGWMDDEQLAERDRIVFEVAATIGVPVAWNLAGGYQKTADGGIEPVLAIHRRTMAACARVFLDKEVI